MKKVSFVIPAYNEEESLEELLDKIYSVADKNNYDFEILIIDDGSTDNTWQKLKELKNQEKFKDVLKIYSFRKNSGKASALSLGFEKAEGEFIATLDADLQDDPEEVPLMIEMIEKENWDMVSGWKKIRHDPISKTLPSKLFNYVTSKISGIRLHDFNCGLKVYRSYVVKEINIYGELHRYIPVLAHWAGFRVTEKVVRHHKRKYGHSKYGFSRFINGFLDLLTVIFLHKYTKKPLHLFGTMGILFLLIGFIINGYFAWIWLITQKLRVRPLMLIGIFSIIVGIQFISLGLLGELIALNSREEEYKIKEYYE